MSSDAVVAYYKAPDAACCDQHGPSAWDVSNEQRKRAFRDGRKLVTMMADGSFYEITPAEDGKSLPPRTLDARAGGAVICRHGA